MSAELLAGATTLLVALLLLTAAGVCAIYLWQRLTERRRPRARGRSRLLVEADRRPDRGLAGALVELAKGSGSGRSGRALRVLARHAATYREATGGVAELLRQGAPERRVAAAATLEALASAAPEVVPHLAADGSSLVRVVAYRALARRTAAPGALRQLLAGVGDEDERVRAEAWRALGALRAPGIARSFAAARLDPSPDVRRAALSAAAAGGDGAALDALVRALGRESSAVARAEIQEALERSPEPPVALWLAKATSGLAAERVAGLRALATYADVRVAERLLPQLEAPEKELRRETARAIAGMERAAGAASTPAIVERLVRRFDAEGSRSTREALCEALAASGSRAALRAVQARLDLPDAAIRERLRDAEAVLAVTIAARGA